MMRNNSSPRFFSASTPQAGSVDMPVVPGKVDLADITVEGSLLTDEQKTRLLSLKSPAFKEKFYTKDEINQLLKLDPASQAAFPYPVIFHEDTFYVGYQGEGKILGEGNHSNIVLVQCVTDNQFYALKIQDDEGLATNEFNMLYRVGLTPQKKPMLVHEPDVDSPVYLLLMNLASGIGIDSIVKKELTTAQMSMEPVLRLELARQVLTELNRLHMFAGVLHRDLQPGNIFLNAVNQSAGFIDFGQATALPSKVSAVSEKRLTGSTRNWSPQMRRQLPVIKRAISEGNDTLMPEVVYNDNSEIYAVGISLAEFFYLLNPVPEDMENFPEQWGSYVMEEDGADAILRDNDILPLNIYTRVLSLMHKMTAPEEKDRISFPAAIQILNDLIAELQSTQKISVGVLNIASLREPGFIEAAIQSAKSKNVNEIWMIHTGQETYTVKELLYIQRKLEEADLRVGGKYYKGPDQQALVAALEEQLACRSLRNIPSQTCLLNVVPTLAVSSSNISAAAAAAAGSQRSPRQ